jgi:hypothetical protein
VVSGLKSQYSILSDVLLSFAVIFSVKNAFSNSPIPYSMCME